MKQSANPEAQRELVSFRERRDTSKRALRACDSSLGKDDEGRAGRKVASVSDPRNVDQAPSAPNPDPQYATGQPTGSSVSFHQPLARDCMDCIRINYPSPPVALNLSLELV